MTRPLSFALACAALALSLLASHPVLAQAMDIQPELLGPRRERPEGGIRFCLNPDSLLVDFDRAMGEAIAEMQLLDVDFVAVDTDYAVPLDFVLMLDQQYLYQALYGQCDALLGYALPSSGIFDWLTATRPYLLTRDIAATVRDDLATLGDLTPEDRIGARVGSRGDGLLLRFTLAQNAGERWRRLPYNGNELLMMRIADGSIDAGIVWEPAFAAAQQAGTIAGIDQVREIPLNPMGEALFAFGAVMFADDTFIRGLLDEAITALIADGTIAALLDDHAIPGIVPDL